MEIDLTTSIHTISSKQVRNYVYKALADRYKIENLRKYISQVSKECSERACSINDLIQEVEKRIMASPTAAKQAKKRGRPPKNPEDELAELFKKSVQVVEKPRRTVQIRRSTQARVPKVEEPKKHNGTKTTPLDNSLGKSSSSSSANKAKKLTTAQRASKRAVQKEMLDLSTIIDSLKMK